VPDPVKDPLGWLTTAGSLPDWLAERWHERLGGETAVARARAALRPAPTTLRLNPRVPEARDLCEAAGVRLSPLTVPGALRAEEGRLVDLARDGVVYVQDEGSQMVARLASGPGLVLDACAAPGGKATLLADLGGAQTRVVAAEAAPHRAYTLRKLVKRWGASGVMIAVSDARRPGFRGGFDTVLLDAPCTGLGTLSRHPDIRWRVRPEDVPRQATRQAEILEALAAHVRPGGRLVYATCSLEDEETVGVVRPFLEAHPRFEAVAPPAWASPFAEADGFLRTRPEVSPGDGFFAVVMTKAAR
jgi:16S rRNA (cytosine967-C5)-methyltransferase